MCGRDYSTYTEEELEMRYLNKHRKWRWPVITEIPEFQSNYNTCPTQLSLVLSVHEEKLGFRSMRWGLVAAWAKSIKDATKYSMINARAEEIAEKRSYKAAFQRRRCIVPVTGFFEWKRTGEAKRPFAIHLKTDSIMSLAGVWEQWTNKDDGEIVESFSLITTAANNVMAKIHDRMPVILAKEDEENWLDPETTHTEELNKYLKPCPDEWIEAYEVSTLVNSPKNNSPDVLTRVD